MAKKITTDLDLIRIRENFPAISSGRIITNNAASTQTTFKLLELCKKLAPLYDNVHRGQSTASIKMTEIFEESYETIADFIGAESPQNIILYRNATEAINSVMYSLLTEFRDGDNVVTTFMEHNSNYVPWYGLCKEILPRFGVNVECRLINFDKATGELDLNHMSSLVDRKTKIVCCTGVSNFLGTINPLQKIKQIADKSGYEQPDGDRRSYLLIDGCQLVPNLFIDINKLNIDFLVWSFHKMLAPFGIGTLYAKKDILSRLRPFLYGGDMIAEGKVSQEYVGYNKLPWKFTAGTPNILGTILSAAAIRNLLDLVLNPEKNKYFNSKKRLNKAVVKKAMKRIRVYEEKLSSIALEEFQQIPDLYLFGPKDAKKRISLFSFVSKKKDPFQIANELSKEKVESRAGCHCATLAHHYYRLNPPASCRLSYYFYNTSDEVKFSIDALKKVLKK